MTKRELLLAICETPGWEPPEEPASSIARAIEELLREGWIVARLDGWEASAKALEEFPDFVSQEDIASDAPHSPPAEEPSSPDEVEMLLPTLSVGARQQVQGEIAIQGENGSALKGSVAISNMQSGRYEIDVTLRIRRR